MKLNIAILTILVCLISAAASGQNCSEPPRGDVRINELQYATSTHPYYVNFLEISGTPGLPLDCMQLIALDADCKVKSALNLNGKSLDGGYLVVSQNAARHTALFGSAPAMQSGVVTGGSSAGGFRVVFAPASAAVGTSCANIGGTQFDAIGFPSADGSNANIFGGEGQEVSGGMAVDRGGSMFRINNQDTGDNSADFQVSCQASVTPGAANADLPCPRATVSPDNLAVGFAAKDVTVENIGSGPLTIFDISTSSGFTKTTNCPVSPLKLSAGSQCTISVSSNGDSENGNLNILADDSTGEHQVSLATGGSDCIFCDDFSDNDVSDWKATKSLWTAGSGEVTTTLSSKGDFASPNFGGCTDCTFETQMKVTAGGRISLFAWHQSSKNTVEICLMQDKQKLLVKQKANLNTAKGAASMQIVPGTTYTIKAIFDGSKFHILVNGVEKVTFTALAAPFGNAMYRVKSPSGASVTGAISGIEVR